MNFTNKEFEAFRADAEKVLLPLAEKYNLTITAGKISYTDNSFSMKVDCTKADVGDLKQKEFETSCALFGFVKSDYMRKFVCDGKEYVLTGLAPSRPKYPCECVETAGNTRYKMTVEAVKRSFGL